MEGLPLSQLEGEYKMYYQQDVKPNMMQMGHWLSWEQIFQQPVFREDFITFEIGQNVYIKANRKRSPLEMSLIAKLARQSHFDAAKKPEFQVPGCICCQQRGQYIINSYPEPIVVKVESGDQTHHIEYPHAMAATLQAGTQGLNNNGETLTISTKNTNTNDGFMLDHRLRVQQQEYSEVQQISNHLGTVGHGQRVQQYGTAVVNDLSKTLAGDKSQLHKADPNQPVFTSQVVRLSLFSAFQHLNNNRPCLLPPLYILLRLRVKKMRVASPPKPIVFKCSTPGCNQEFPDKQHQIDHERRCEMKRYPCTFPGCDRRFRNSKQRHTHVSSVHRRSEPGFKCSVPECTATFRGADKLKVHESRCRFKYVTLQQMALEGQDNHLQNPVTDGIVINVPAENIVKLGNCDGIPEAVSTVDLSIVKAEGYVKSEGS
ncbi:Zinc finger protein-likeZIC 4 [Orchesella cincta]|uniref:Zinc finger protein-likeZIC 4 n=1 Tax=Orchesella cincta TaxID=48709 RepID=A0A1D2N2V2_ORCCI|nr:Zinc finger protein-likeZIC 4 [Orchesella cincta]